MIRSPFACVLAPDSGPRIESALAVEHVAQALCTVVVPATAPNLTRYWHALNAAQDFYARPTAPSESLDEAVAAYRAEAMRRESQTPALSVMLTLNGEVIVTATQPGTTPPAAVMALSPADDFLSPRSDWQRFALQTNSRAQLQAFRRSLAERNAADALVLAETVSPVLGSLIVLASETLHSASGTTMVPPHVETLVHARAFTAHVAMSPTISPDHLAAAEAAWWISPEFVVTPLTRLLDRELAPRSADDYIHLGTKETGD